MQTEMALPAPVDGRIILTFNPLPHRPVVVALSFLVGLKGWRPLSEEAPVIVIESFIRTGFNRSLKSPSSSELPVVNGYNPIRPLSHGARRDCIRSLEARWFIALHALGRHEKALHLRI